MKEFSQDWLLSQPANPIFFFSPLVGGKDNTSVSLYSNHVYWDNIYKSTFKNFRVYLKIAYSAFISIETV